MRRIADVRAAEAAGADAVGFVVGPSPRRIEPEEAAKLVAGTELETFLVTVDLAAAELVDLASFTGVGGVQPHGVGAVAAADAAERAGLRVLRPVPASPDLRLELVPPGQIPLVDTPGEGLHGGTGRVGTAGRSRPPTGCGSWPGVSAPGRSPPPSPSSVRGESTRRAGSKPPPGSKTPS